MTQKVELHLCMQQHAPVPGTLRSRNSSHFNLFVFVAVIFLFSFETVRLLASLGADLTLKDKSGNSALHHASMNLNFVATKVLIDAGAQLDAVNNDVRHRMPGSYGSKWVCLYHKMNR